MLAAPLSLRCTLLGSSDFVIQFGLHGSGVTHTFGDLPVNETAQHVRLSNTRGTAAIAHWDVPDCGAPARRGNRPGSMGTGCL